MKFNICCSEKTFESKEWMVVYDEFHRDLKIASFSGKEVTMPSMFLEYWYYLWDKDSTKIGKEFCSPKNLRLTSRIWEYVHTLACIYYNLSEIRGKKILSLGAGLESPLWTLSRWGAEVYASDMYEEKGYWHPEWVPFLKTNPEVFSPYNEKYPVNFVNLNLQKPKKWTNIGIYDVIYSISSIEHVYEHLESKIGLLIRIVKHLKSSGIFSFTTELITSFENKRRKDFYTREELEKIIYVLADHGLSLADIPLWETATEQEVPSDGCSGQKHTAISLTFLKR